MAPGAQLFLYGQLENLTFFDTNHMLGSLRTADAFPVVASLEATPGNASAVRRLYAGHPRFYIFRALGSVFFSTALKFQAHCSAFIGIFFKTK